VDPKNSETDMLENYFFVYHDSLEVTRYVTLVSAVRNQRLAA
jgi:hypothetical protein